MRSSQLLARRHFLKTFTFICAYSSLFDKSWTSLLAAEIKPLAASSTGTLRVRLGDFPALQQESGSVRLMINPLRGNPPSGPIPNGTFYPVIINRAANNTFYALNSRCTHQNCAVDPLDPSSNTLSCPCHNSIFAIDGKRLAGPAPSGLTRYTVRFDGQETLDVQIPNLGYSVVASSVPSAGGTHSRLSLDFRALRNVEYEVYFQESIETAPRPVAFSLTPDGPVEQSVFLAPSTANVSVFLERSATTGFYTVAVRLSEG